MSLDENGNATPTSGGRAFVILAHDCGFTLLEGTLAKRCASCGLMLEKRAAAHAASVTRHIRHPLCATGDGFTLARTDFVDSYASSRLDGLRLTRVGTCWLVEASRILPFDAKARGTRFEHPCGVCGQFESVVGATPARLELHAAPGENGFARTDLEFGSLDEKAPLLLGGERAAQWVRSFPRVDVEEVVGGSSPP